MNIPNYKVLTKKSVLDILYYDDQQHGKDLQELWEEQNQILKDNGHNLYTVKSLHFFEDKFTYERYIDDNIDEAIQCLSIKEGCDLVKYETGNIGFVAYYGSYVNGFEILGEYEESEDD